jgi:hypothetical protein
MIAVKVAGRRCIIIPGYKWPVACTIEDAAGKNVFNQQG